MTTQIALRFDQVPITCPVQERYHTIAPWLAGLRTPAEAAAEKAVLHVLGPRINLALISWRFRNFRKPAGTLSWNLPYETIIAGTYNDTPVIE
jgi:hypothetical protein